MPPVAVLGGSAAAESWSPGPGQGLQTTRGWGGAGHAAGATARAGGAHASELVGQPACFVHNKLNISLDFNAKLRTHLEQLRAHLEQLSET